MQKMKKLAVFLLLIVIIGVFGFLWITKFSPKARKAKINVENSYKLEIGMNTDDMIKIMGAPKSINYYEKGKGGDSVYFYTPPFASSDGIEVIINRDTISKINYFE